MADQTPQDLVEDFRAELRRLTSEHPTSIGVAVSGGGDSMALLDLTLETTLFDRVTVATVDHGLRREARDEAEMVSRYCASRGIEHDVLRLPSMPEQGNLSANLRVARYSALVTWAKELGLRSILVGHTMDDQAETLLMRLARGSGVEGLSAMAPARDVNGISFLRPMLGLRRADLRSWLTVKGVRWADDPTNDDDSYDRIKARQALELLTPLGIDVPGLAETAHRLKRQEQVLLDAARAFRDLALQEDDEKITIDRNHLRNTVPDTGMRVLADALRRIGGQAYRPRFRSLLPLYEKAVGFDVTSATLAGCLIGLNEHHLTVIPERKPRGRGPAPVLDDNVAES
ncbi:MAG: tRNA lysidine(34) synthetase TilS [Pseudomonadota bacterium]